MQFSENWLRQWANPNISSEELSHLLTMAGLEVEERNAAGLAFSGVVIAEVKEVVQHENADRLRVTQVDVGNGELVQIVCGAPNVAVGLKVPCALSGALLPGDFAIKPTTMRGVVSNGMLCSGKELGIPDDVDGLLVLPEDATVGQSIREYLGLDDQCFTLKITPNRADALSILGLAREVGALTKTAVNEPEEEIIAITSDKVKAVQIEASDACGRYVGRVIEGVNADAVAPLWLRQRLERSGVRSISAIVDITNYVMLELGQPMHAFDFDKLKGDVVVRMAKDGETLECLNEKKVTLASNTLVIADQENVLAMAGLMGGDASAVTAASQNIFLESAYFAPDAIAGQSRQYGFGSDSSFRYERGVDFNLQVRAMERATALITQICGGRVGALTEVSASLPVLTPVNLRFARLNKVLGIHLEPSAVVAILQGLGLELEVFADSVSVQAPSFRFDIRIEEDLIEEVARVYGYENIETRAPQARLAMLPLAEELLPREQLRRKLVQRSYQEVITYAFVDAKWEADFAGNSNAIALQNPIASQMGVMRSSLIGGLVDVLANNQKRKQARVRVFEIARVFLRPTDTQSLQDDACQPERIAGLAWGGRLSEQWGAANERVDFYDVKADVEALLHPKTAQFVKAEHSAMHPGRTAAIEVDGVRVGYLGELHPQLTRSYDLGNSPIVFELDLGVLTHSKRIKATAVSKFQATRRDIALVVKESQDVGSLLAALKGAASDVVVDVRLFDVYRGKGVEEGFKSLAFAIILQAQDRTLVEEELEQSVQALLDAALSQYGATLRA